ncbi:ATP-binding cassette domain-containing protein [Methylophilus luteus]|uniref:ATP-binding cassette domain-containing protein n=1 Tax=Methylophilus luteus TaxID=640108 RepID=A0ABW3F1S7_9PROT
MIASFKKRLPIPAYIIDALQQVVFTRLVLMSVFLAISDLAGILLIFPFVSLAMNPDYIQSHQFLTFFFTDLTHGELIIYSGISLIVAYLVKARLHQKVLRSQNEIIAGFTKDLTDDFLHKTINAKYEFFSKLSTSRLAGIAFSNTIHASITLQMMLSILTELFFLLLLLITFIVSMPFVALGIIFISLLYFVFLYKPISKKVTYLGVLQNNIENLRHRVLHSLAASIRDIKIMSLGPTIESYSRDISSKFAESNWMFATTQGLTRIYLETLMLIGIVISIILFLSHGSDIQKATPLIALATLAALKALPSLAKLISSINAYKYSCRFVQHLLDTSIQLDSNQQLKRDDSLSFDQQLCIDNLYFSYGDKPTLKSISMTIQKGSSVGIVGPSGSGKSTLLDIITGLLETKQGVFSLDNQVIEPFSSKSFSSILGYVPQSITLFDESISYNITFEAHPDKTRLKQAIEISKLDHFIESLQDKEATKIGEGGINLSGGQKQRLAIARAIYKAPKILVFDEPTSALDSITEKAFIADIAKLHGVVTTIIVSHKLSNVTDCDNIYVMDKGTIIDSGVHESLLVSCNLYKTMYHTQLTS